MTAAQEIQRYNPTAAVSQSTAIEQSRAVAEVQAQVLVAQSCPRNTRRAVAEVSESCGRLAMANQAFYAVPNRGDGNSVHLLRELARAWGNIQHGSHELRRDDTEGISEVQAWAWDVETNTRTSRTFIVPHERQTRSGRNKLTDLGDIQNNNNNVAARAVRECIAAVLPKWFVEEAADRCRQTLENGEGVPLSERIELMVTWFGAMGVTVPQIEARLDKKRAQWDASDVASMQIAGKSIKAGEATKAELFPAAENSTTMEIAGYQPEPVDPDPTPAQIASPAAVDPPSSTKPARKSRAARNGERNAERAELEAATVAAAVAADQAEGNPAENADNRFYREPPAEPEPSTEHTEHVHIATEAPGALTEETPGQTDRVEKALDNARNKSNARIALLDLLAACFRDAGYKMPENLATVASSILKITIKDADTLTDSQLKTIHNSLNAWRQVDTLADMVTGIIEAADMNAEAAGDQTTLN